jgi:hypothetical protein
MNEAIIIEYDLNKEDETLILADIENLRTDILTRVKNHELSKEDACSEMTQEFKNVLNGTAYNIALCEWENKGLLSRNLPFSLHCSEQMTFPDGTHQNEDFDEFVRNVQLAAKAAFFKEHGALPYNKDSASFFLFSSPIEPDMTEVTDFLGLVEDERIRSIDYEIHQPDRCHHKYFYIETIEDLIESFSIQSVEKKWIQAEKLTLITDSFDNRRIFADKNSEDTFWADVKAVESSLLKKFCETNGIRMLTESTADTMVVGSPDYKKMKEIFDARHGEPEENPYISDIEEEFLKKAEERKVKAIARAEKDKNDQSNDRYRLHPHTSAIRNYMSEIRHLAAEEASKACEKDWACQHDRQKANHMEYIVNMQLIRLLCTENNVRLFRWEDASVIIFGRIYRRGE